MEIEELRAYQIEWYKRKKKEADARYYSKEDKQILIKKWTKEYYEQNKEIIDQYRKQFYDQHKTEYKLKRREYKHEWYLKNKNKTMEKKQNPTLKSSVRISDTAQKILRKIKDEQFKKEGYWMPYTKIIELLGLKKLEEMGVDTDLSNKK